MSSHHTRKIYNLLFSLSLLMPTFSWFASAAKSQNYINTENRPYAQEFTEIKKSLETDNYTGATKSLQSFLDSPKYLDMNDGEAAGFFQELSQVFKENNREADEKKAIAEALKRMKGIKLTSAASELPNQSAFQEALIELNSGQAPAKAVSSSINLVDGTIETSAEKGAVPESSGIRKKLEELSILTTQQIQILRSHAVTTGAGGYLSADGIIGSSPEQIDAIFKNIEASQKHSVGKPIDLLIYVHGGLTSEADALRVAAKQLPLWKESNVYPIFFVWKSGLEEMLADATGLRFLDQHKANGKSVISLVQIPTVPLPSTVSDVLIEEFSKSAIRKLWLDMKVKSLEGFNKPLFGNVNWSNPLSISRVNAGGSLFVDRLDEFKKKVPKCRVHLVGHSAGSILLAAAVDALSERNIPITSVHLLAPAITVSDFRSNYLPLIRTNKIQACYLYNLSDELEQKDSISAGFFKYNKSLLYLVSRALEQGNTLSKDNEVPLLGLSKFLPQKAWPGTSRSLIAELKISNAKVIISPPPAANAALCNASSHGGFGLDQATLHNIISTIRKSN